MNEFEAGKNAFKKQTEAFQKIWSDTVSKFSQPAGPNAAPGAPIPEILRDLKQAVQQTIARSWEDFLQSDAFQNSMKAASAQASSARESAQDLFKKVRKETQGITREDFENIQRAIRNAEQLLLTRMDLLESRMAPKKRPVRRQPAKRAPVRKKSSPK